MLTRVVSSGGAQKLPRQGRAIDKVCLGRASASCTPGLRDAIIPPSTETLGLGGCHTGSFIGIQSWIGVVWRLPDHPRGRFSTPASKRELTNSKHHMVPSPRPTGDDMGIDLLVFRMGGMPINARRLQVFWLLARLGLRTGPGGLGEFGRRACCLFVALEAVQQGPIGPCSSHPGPVSRPLCCLALCGAGTLRYSHLGPLRRSRNTQQTPLFQGLAIRTRPNPPRIGSLVPLLPTTIATTD